MQEKEKNASTVKFLSVWGKKILSGESFSKNDDTTDQRAPVNDPFDLYNQFVMPDEIMDELDAERIDDFDNDFYDYEDRTDLGVDIAAAAQLSLKDSKERLKNSRKKAVEKPADEQDVDGD